MLSLKYMQRLNEACASPTPERDALRLIETICAENSPGSVDGHSTAMDFVWTVAYTVLGNIPSGFCSPAGRESCLHSRPRNRCKDCPVADDPTVTLPAASPADQKPAPDAVLEATQAQHVGRLKGEPAKFVRNGKLETCRCFDCRALTPSVPRPDRNSEAK